MSDIIGLHSDSTGYLFDANDNCIGKTYNREHAKIIAETYEVGRSAAKHIEALQDKIKAETCACSYDKPTDVCMGHSPTVARQELEIRQLNHQLNLLGEALGKCLIAGGIINDQAWLDGPQLLMFAEDLENMLRGKLDDV